MCLQKYAGRPSMPLNTESKAAIANTDRPMSVGRWVEGWCSRAGNLQ